MKQSLMTNVIQFDCTGTGTVSVPVSRSQYPCGEYIRGIVAQGTSKFFFKLIQDGRQVFPVRTNFNGGYFTISNLGLQPTSIDLIDLWIPVNPNLLLTIEFCNVDGTACVGTVTLIIASEDYRSVLIETLKNLTNKLSIIKEVQK